MMKNKLSDRLVALVRALPINDGSRILEIGCGSGAMAREISRQLKNGHVLAIDRSAKAIRQAIAGSTDELESGQLTFMQVAIEDFDMDTCEKPFDMAVAIRVGALDGRHPEIEKQALQKITKSLKKSGKLFIDGGNPLKEIPLDEYRSKMTTPKTLRTCKQEHQYYKSSDCPTCPICEKLKEPASSFLSLLSSPARNALLHYGIDTIEKLAEHTEKEILALHGIGKASLPAFKKALEEAGLNFKIN